VQDFYPTPGTVSTCMFYTGLDPYTLQPIYVPRSPQEKAEQRALLQYFKPENRAIVLKALRAAGRTDLIGNGPNCLVKDDRPKPSATSKKPIDRRARGTKPTRKLKRKS
ncbi:MAG: DUF3362 domain-containing protein, partial [Clostridia bacterium]|nr:DUF3362 domain-containing protein [Clostridia bacterium]